MIGEQLFNMLDAGLVILDRQLGVRQWNRWIAVHSGIEARKIVGSHLFEFFPELDNPKFHRSFKAVLTLGNLSFFSQKLHGHLFPCRPVSTFGMNIVHMQQNCTMGPLRDEDNAIRHVFISIHDVTEIVAYELSLQEALDKANRLAEDLEAEHARLEVSHHKLQTAQTQVLQQEKLASIGQLAAGVAHEINNPMGFIASNLNTLQKYTGRLTEFIAMQTALLKSSPAAEELNKARKRLKLDYILADTADLIVESQEGAERVKTIVRNLKSFSRVDQAQYCDADINHCLESTLNIVWNELKYKATVSKDFGKLPTTRCYPQQLNQVFMNILVNAAQSIEKQGEISIRTWQDDDVIKIAIRDTGCGIAKEKINRIFEPFFTTKPVGKGTGLGMSIAYDIIRTHNGTIDVQSNEGQGTTFTVSLPIAAACTPNMDKTTDGTIDGSER